MTITLLYSLRLPVGFGDANHFRYREIVQIDTRFIRNGHYGAHGFKPFAPRYLLTHVALEFLQLAQLQGVYRIYDVLL